MRKDGERLDVQTHREGKSQALSQITKTPVTSQRREIWVRRSRATGAASETALCRNLLMKLPGSGAEHGVGQRF